MCIPCVLLSLFNSCLFSWRCLHMRHFPGALVVNPVVRFSPRWRCSVHGGLRSAVAVVLLVSPANCFPLCQEACGVSYILRDVLAALLLLSPLCQGWPMCPRCWLSIIWALCCPWCSGCISLSLRSGKDATCHYLVGKVVIVMFC